MCAAEDDKNLTPEQKAARKRLTEVDNSTGANDVNANSEVNANGEVNGGSVVNVNKKRSQEVTKARADVARADSDAKERIVRVKEVAPPAPTAPAPPDLTDATLMRRALEEKGRNRAKRGLSSTFLTGQGVGQAAPTTPKNYLLGS